MKLTRSKKVILTIILIVGMVFMFSNDSVFAAINKGYSGTDVVTNTALDTAFDESSLLGLLAKLIYAIGRFLEWILGLIFKMLTGVADFPWADKIVFNSVPLLDVNFINPDPQSFVGNPAMKIVLKNIYSTILSLAVSFFGMVVLITAIKLVVSTIASEKAKYKQAIVDWAIGLVLLFCIHYFISFVFYLNEELVKVASSVVKQQISKAEAAGKPIVQAQTATVSKELVDRIEAEGVDSTILKNNMNVVQAWLALDSSEESRGAHEYLTKRLFFGADFNRMKKNEYQELVKIVTWATASSPTVEELQAIRDRIKLYKDGGKYAQALSTSDFNKLPKSDVFTASGIHLKNCADDANTLCKGSPGKDKVYYITQGAERFGYGSNITSSPVIKSFYWTDVLDDLITVKASAATDTAAGGYTKGTRLIADLASYFRYNSYSVTLRDLSNTGVKSDGNIKIQNMLMYTILVAQSLILFIAYIKRLFYVLMLALLAPVVVVVDFFQKFGK